MFKIKAIALHFTYFLLPLASIFQKGDALRSKKKVLFAAVNCHGVKPTLDVDSVYWLPAKKYL